MTTLLSGTVQTGETFAVFDATNSTNIRSGLYILALSATSPGNSINSTPTCLQFRVVTTSSAIASLTFDWNIGNVTTLSLLGGDLSIRLYLGRLLVVNNLPNSSVSYYLYRFD